LGKTAPREVIHLLNSIREEEVKRIEQGHPPPLENRLFDRSVLKAALPAVSTARLVQTIYAEYPDTRRFLEKLKGQKTEQTPNNLAIIWGIPEVEVQLKTDELVNVGFFQRKGSGDAQTFWVPFLYRDALQMIQGKAGEVAYRESDEDE
jgi:hypothetical protein